MSEVDISQKRGLVATVVISGHINQHFGQSLANMRSWCDRNGFHAIEWRTFDAKLVEAGRDDALRHALNEGYEWVLQVDADAAPFPDTALARMLNTMFVDAPHLDVLGAYCQLKAPPYLCTIDTGTGTWEEHYPGEGLLPVIRTGGHFLMVKTAILKRFGPPWFRTRIAMPPAKAFAEVDNFARTKLDGMNPLVQHPEWMTLLTEAHRLSPHDPGVIGEDSGFCDSIKAIGGQIAVDTDLVAGHVGTKAIKPEDLWDMMEDLRRSERLLVGVME